MGRFLLLCYFAFSSFSAFSQTVYSSLQSAVSRLEADPQMKYGILGLHITDASTGKPVFSRNSAIGIAVASSQKVITAAAALELLGQDFRYTTTLAASGYQVGSDLNGDLVLTGTGDPTLGSWRYQQTVDTAVINKWVNAVKSRGIKNIRGGITVIDHNSSSSLSSTIPEGYIWQDIGNYYGAGTCLTNWHENQYDVILRSGASGKPVVITALSPSPPLVRIHNQVVAGKAGSGDNAYIFAAPYSDHIFIRGTIPPNSNRFTIAGSLPDPGMAVGSALQAALLKEGIVVDSLVKTAFNAGIRDKRSTPNQLNIAHQSPPLDSIIYWFLRKSINVYGEALVKTLSMQQDEGYELDKGITILKKFWQKQGVEDAAINIIDGSGLSPSSRVTAAALVSVMMYAKKRPWFRAFYEALPEYNGLKMKSGTIGGAKSFTGYVRSKSGKEYVFAIVVNNFSGSASQIVEKMYGVLNVLK
jgi:serine-type D-Ala-D-Ala carboxypeptidase/endopeptidase (penicillin-binding protein 4)